MTPALDTRTKNTISSRVGLEEECIIVKPDENIIIPDDTDILMVDEVQFMTSEQIIQLWNISREKDIRVFCYGLKTTYKNTLFESIPTLLLYRDKEEELKSQCCMCENKATTHVLYKDGILVKDNEEHSEINIGDIVGEERYESLCQDCRKKIQK